VVRRTVHDHDDADVSSKGNDDLSVLPDALSEDVDREISHKQAIGPGLWVDGDLLRGHTGWCTTYR
jgi:hypothetical protein